MPQPSDHRANKAPCRKYAVSGQCPAYREITSSRRATGEGRQIVMCHSGSDASGEMIYVLIFIYIYTYIYIYVYIYIRIYIRIYLCVYNIYIRIYIYTYIYIRIYLCVYYIYVYICVCVRVTIIYTLVHVSYVTGKGNEPVYLCLLLSNRQFQIASPSHCD